MTSKLKCPFCNKDLILSYITDDLCCEECWESATEKVWQALIQAKQDLEIARKALDEARINLDAIHPYLGDEYILACRQDGLKAIDDALEQIEHKD